MRAYWWVGVTDAEAAAYTGPEIFDVYQDNLPPDTVENYYKYRHFDTVAQKVTQNPGVTLNVCVREWYPETVWEQLDAIFGYRQALSTSVPNPLTGLSAAMTLYRKSPERRFSEQDRLIKQTLMPHLITVFARSQLAHWIRDAAKEIRYPLAAIADEAGALRHVGEGFAEMLQREWPDWRGLMLPEPLLAKVALRVDGEFSGTHIVAKITFRQDLPLVQLRPKPLSDHLSTQQLKVARYAAEGLNFKEIARLMDLSPGTVRNYLHNTYRKLGIKRKIQLTELLREVE